MGIRGRQQGQLQNQRDERGWMVPRPGTLRRAIYEALVAGNNPADIRQALSLGRDAFATHKAYIMRWRKVHRWRNPSPDSRTA